LLISQFAKQKLSISIEKKQPIFEFPIFFTILGSYEYHPIGSHRYSVGQKECPTPFSNFLFAISPVSREMGMGYQPH